MTDNQQQMFAPSTPIVTANGTATAWMLRWMLSIWNRTGGAQSSVGPKTVTVTASETVAAGSVCNLYSAGGKATIRNANASDLTKYANCFVLERIYLNQTGTAHMPGEWMTGLNLIPGDVYWLSTTPGQLTTTPATSANGAAGTQIVGWADDTGSQLFFQPQPIFGV